ncbi:type IV toxin-antitoxin system AbiEi family antitoxin domain-containing protein [Sinorhizobium meliloti]|uniref:type IV toxin-antitoxin system AbiEi family antitoxin domain-containing protein n=2 Tax=Sinorhizobium TaxID=28105 RepID=UPI0024A60DAB|nr:type IV toxin-antitoxin system AbiEi family antitoxin domain-containing protein [Sinorhizobium meliloti]
MPLDAERRLLLLDLLPEGMPVTRSWLIRQEPTMDRHAVDNLLKSRQLVSIAHAVYLRPGTRMSWESVVASLQNIFHFDLTPGGLTAIEQQGFAHYLPISSKRQIHLYGKDAIPKWLAAALPDIEFLRHLPLPNLGAAGLSNFEYDSQERTLFRPETPGQRKSAWPFTMSSPERAYLEVLQDVPETISFEHAEQLLQGMTTLSPRVMERLLRKCTHVKVRRLFYWMAERHSYPWLKKLPQPDTLDGLGLGRGNRMLAKGGKLDKKYMITVPEDMWTPPAPTTDKSGS